MVWAGRAARRGGMRGVVDASDACGTAERVGEKLAKISLLPVPRTNTRASAPLSMGRGPALRWRWRLPDRRRVSSAGADDAKPVSPAQGAHVVASSTVPPFGRVQDDGDAATSCDDGAVYEDALEVRREEEGRQEAPFEFARFCADWAPLSRSRVPPRHHVSTVGPHAQRRRRRRVGGGSSTHKHEHAHFSAPLAPRASSLTPLFPARVVDSSLSFPSHPPTRRPCSTPTPTPTAASASLIEPCSTRSAPPCWSLSKTWAAPCWPATST